AVVGVLSRDHSLLEERIRERGKCAERIRAPPGEEQAVVAVPAGFETKRAGRRAGADLRSVDAQAIDLRDVARLAGQDRHRADEDAAALVDLRAIEIFVSFERERAVADLDVEWPGRRGLGGHGRDGAG